MQEDEKQYGDTLFKENNLTENSTKIQQFRKKQYAYKFVVVQFSTTKNQKMLEFYEY